MLTCCNKQFSSKQSLAGHRRDYHGGIFCDQCNKAFYSKRSLDSHKSRYHKQNLVTRKEPTLLFCKDDTCVSESASIPVFDDKKSGLGTTSQGAITLDGTDTGIDYEKFVKDCNVLCFKPEYECLYQRLVEQGYDFFEK